MDVQCPRCGGRLSRIHRRRIDRLLNLVRPLKRYRCETYGCQWAGNVRARGQDSASSPPARTGGTSVHMGVRDRRT